MELLPEQQFVVQINIDLIELMQNQDKLTGNSDQIIEQLKSYSKLQWYRSINQVKQRWLADCVFLFNQQPVHLTQLYPPTVQQIVMLMAQPAQSTDYRVTFIGSGDTPSQARQLQFRLPEEFGPIKLTLSRPTKALISSGVTTDSFDLSSQSNISETAMWLDNVLNYIKQGIIHIIPKGLDHILFVVALFLLSNRWSALLWQVSAFTLAHTVTLALGILGYVSISSNLVEPLIALSIAYVAIENIRHSTLNKWRVLLVFGFGLLHGLGFASVLIEVGIPPQQWLSSLIAFNVGVELGQLGVIALAFILLGWFRRYSWYRQYVVVTLSSVIAVIACYWFIERLH
jgi:hypothetical protein